MMRCLERWLVVVLLVFSIGTPWTLLQSAAWLRMVVNFSRTTSLVEAVNRTFDGKHPCRMCLLIKEGQQKEREQKSESAQPLQKLELGLPPGLAMIYHPSVPRDYAVTFMAAELRRESPPAPPPRA